MNADKFFEQYSIEEISKRTKISPISLRYIKNKEYEKIPRVKFMGFMNIIQREFNVNLSDLIEEYNTATNSTPQKEETPKPAPVKKEKNNLIFILSIILLALSGGIIYLYTSGSDTAQAGETPLEVTAIEVNRTINATEPEKIKNSAQKKPKKTDIHIQALQMAKTSEVQIPVGKKVSQTLNVTITPNEKVWYKAVNLDTNKTFEYLTSNPKTLPGGNYYIKFGHGNVTIEYGDKIIEPNTKKIVKILLKNGEYKYVDKGFRP